MIKRKLIISTILCASLALNAFALEDNGSVKTIDLNENTSPAIKTINLNTQSASSVKSIALAQNDKSILFANAIDKFVQSNVKSSYADFKKLIDDTDKNDFEYLTLANELSEFGFFTLAKAAISKTTDKEISRLYIDEISRFYYPKKKLKVEDEEFLGEIYSNITYNDQAREATNDLLKNTKLMSESDYANYLVALGFYKSNNVQRAKKYIDIAIIQNPQNLNYKRLKAKILSENIKPAEALKIVEELKRQDIYTTDFQKKINSLEQYVLYKSSTSAFKKNYHLGYYYYFENDYTKAAKFLQDSISNKKKNLDQVYALLGEIYINLNETEKAKDCIKKASKINSKNAQNHINQGDLKYQNNDFKGALNQYKAASQRIDAQIKTAKTYQKLGNTKKAKEIYARILKSHSDNFEAYYNSALLDKTHEVSYLKKSVAINLLFQDGWIDLARVEIENTNFELAQKYLNNAFYIDENNFRYYYYQGLVYKNSGENSQAQYNFKKCLKLNPKFEPAQKELAL